MADLKPVYLICGDDDAKTDAWRSRVRKRAEAENGPGGLESFDAGRDDAEAVVASLSALTFATGTRYVMVDDVGAWKAAAAAPLTDAIAALPPDTVLVLVVRGKPLKSLVTAVEQAGGRSASTPAPKPWEMPKWATGRARELGLRLDNEAAKTLVAIVGSGQQRLSRELEKISIALYPEPDATVDDVERLAAGESSPKVYDLADAVVGGNVESAIELAEELTEWGERPSRFVYPIVGRLREVHRAVELLESGMTEKSSPAPSRCRPGEPRK